MARILVYNDVQCMMDGPIAKPDYAPNEMERGLLATGWKKFARAGWVVCAAIAWVSLILSVTAQISTLAVQGVLASRPEALVIADLFAQTVAALISLVLAGVLYVKLRHEGLVLLTAYFLLANAMTVTSLTYLEPYWPGAQLLPYGYIQPILYAPLLVALLAVFPNGRFTPAWARWLVVTTVLFTPLGVLQITPQAYSRPTPAFGLALLAWFVILFAGLFAQIHRYRRYSTAIERQQSKWFLFGLSMQAILTVLFTVLTVGANYFSLDVTQMWWHSLINPGRALAFAALPVALTFAVMRYRLFDIDLLINRTLVYGALTAGVASLYALVVGGLGVAFQSNRNLAGALLTTALVALLLPPLRAQLQRGVDRLVPTGRTVGEAVAASPTGKSLESSSASRPRWMRPARVGWLVCMTVGLAVYILAGVALLVERGQALVVQVAAVGGTPLALSLQAGAIVGMAGVALFAVVVAAVLFFKRPDDPMALYLAYFYLIFGFIQAGPGPLAYLESLFLNSRYIVSGVLQTLLFGPALVILLCIFPDGRFAPPWARRLAIASLIYAPLSVLMFYTLSSSVSAMESLVGVVGWFVLFFAGLYAQIRRYRFFSSSLERQQTKWIIYGFGVAFPLAMIPSLDVVGLIGPPLSLPHSWWELLMRLCWVVSSLALPLTLSFAVLRYRLYGIDLIINRTLVYGALTACVVGLYVLLVGALGLLFQSLGSLLIALLATGIIAVLFQPLRERLQRGVNKLIYGERDDPLAALARLGRRLESAVPPEQVLPTLVETIAQSLKLPYAAIHLPVDGQNQVMAEYGRHRSDLVQFPLIYQGEPTGQLVVATRSQGSAFSPEEMRLLRNLARQAGSAVHSVRLTGDLLRSRQELVTAREEERRRLRRDLHDGLGATLAAVNLEAAALRRSIRSEPDKAEALVDEFRGDIRATIDDIRRLVYELRPPTLDQLGLADAVRALAVQGSRAEALQITVEAPEALPPLPAAVEVAAYRIVQEALTNVVTHAQAQHCVVRLEVGDDLRVEVVDDGVGIANGREPNGGLGLLSMRERAEELGGACLIEPAAEGGTRVLASLPLPED